MNDNRSTFDLDVVRADTPGVCNRLHFNNAGAALVSRPVLDAIVGHLQREAEIGGYEAAAEATDRLAGVHGSIARLIGASSDEIAVTENATVAWQRAFQAMEFRAGDRILTTTAEFAANYIAFLQLAKRVGVSIETIPDDASGALAPEALEAMVDERVRLIAVTWLPTNGGLINPAAAVGRIARAHGIPYLLDACQAAGQLRIDVEELGCDMLTATGRKFLRAPRGTGFLYMRREMLERTEPALLDLFGAVVDEPGRYTMRPDARRFETWETNYAARLGLGAAADYAVAVGMDAIEARCLTLGGAVREGLGGIDGVTIRDAGACLSAIVSFTVDGIDALNVMHQLTARQINVSVSPPSSTPLDAALRRLPPVVRASPHYYNSEAEVDALIEAVAAL